MAQICCICKARIGVVDSSAALTTDTPKLRICGSCLGKRRLILNAKSGTPNVIAARDYFSKILEDTPDLPPEVKEHLTFIISRAPAPVEPTNEQKQQANEIALKKEYLSSLLMTTGYEFQGYKITSYLGVISGEVALGTGFVSEFYASVSDFFGVESNAFADKLRGAKDAAVKKLQMNAYQLNANALIGLDFDYISFSGNMIGISANATAVIIEKLPD